MIENRARKPRITKQGDISVVDLNAGMVLKNNFGGHHDTVTVPTLYSKFAKELSVRGQTVIFLSVSPGMSCGLHDAVDAGSVFNLTIRAVGCFMNFGSIVGKTVIEDKYAAAQ